MAHIGNSVNVVAKNFHIKFICNAGGVMKRHVDFGEMCDSDEEEHDTNSVEYNQFFDTEQLSRVTKMSGLSINTQIFTKKGLPLLFKSSVGSLGKISIFIKSKDLLEKENCVLENSDDES
jgi:hypothetical protein